MTDMRIFEVGLEPTPFSHSAEGRSQGFTEIPQIRVGSQSEAASVAGAISEAIKRFRTCEVTMIGAPSISQGVKALAISRGHLACVGLDLILRPAFFQTIVNDKDLTGVKFTATVQAL